ncbi:MAG TPA: NAD-dependent epimerase/dehydratase family protein [Plantibacter sp.]|uniref:NAD-dependent epimerase/dehydratase family protein n=1 Tax=unclassified Plantibacter TaxID=2624265 RepID=UPI002C1068FC|nr:NAD-dependent epimerase/dehydratase family protein [Plantibacter sp.]
MILVTGGAGFIGRAVVRALISRGEPVRVVDSLRIDVHGTHPAPPTPGAEFLHGDLQDRGVVAAALDGVDTVLHLAAKVGLGVSLGDAPDYIASNDQATAELVAGMAVAGVGRLVLSSSMVVYGEGAYLGASGPTRPAPRRLADLEAGRFEPRSADGEQLRSSLILEDATLDPRNVYASSKLAQEHLAAAWARASGGVAAVLRYHNVYGPGMPQNTPYAGVASLFRSALARREAPLVFEDGRQRRDFVHVDDVASANLAALDWTAAQLAGTVRPFNIGSGVVHTIGEVASALCADDELDPVITGAFRLGDVRHITASSERARRELAWEPRVAFDDGMRDFRTAPLRPAAR